MVIKGVESKKKHTLEKIDCNQIRQLLSENNSARIKTWLSICSKCGLCAESCFYYLEKHDPKLSPAYKVKSTLGELYRKNGEVDYQFLKKCYEILWFKCTMCKRCSLYCPFGIDIASMMSIGRNICFSQGVTPKELVEFTSNCKISGNHMGLPPEEIIDVCEWVVDETEDEISGVTIPIDKKNVKYMYTLNPREVVFYPQDIADAAILFTLAEESWTLPSFGWDCTNLPMFAGDRDAAAQAVQNVYRQAQKLGAEKILITECGHAYRSLAFEGPYLAGYPDGKPPVEIIHYVELLYKYLTNGRIVIDPTKKLKEPVTYQDPCNVARNGGLWKEPREIMEYIAEDFRDMSPSGVYNHCCGGGSGIMPMGPHYKPGRMDAGKIKADQIKETGATIVIAPCHNCYDQIHDLGEKYNLGIEVLSLKEAILKMVVIPEKYKPKT
jgi:Fe-S oxidoreductase